MNEWIYEWKNEWMNEWMIDWLIDWLNEWMNEWMNKPTVLVTDLILQSGRENSSVWPETSATQTHNKLVSGLECSILEVWWKIKSHQSGRFILKIINNS